MHLTERVTISRDYGAVRDYVHETFFARLKELKVGAIIQLIGPRVVRETETDFKMRHVLEKNVIFEVVVYDSNPTTTVDVSVTWHSTGFILTGILASLLTCGLLAALFIPILLIKRGRCQRNFETAAATLKSDLWVPSPAPPEAPTPDTAPDAQ